MIFNKNIINIYESYNINIPESTLIKLEDHARKGIESLLTIRASTYGMRNRNWTVYRHDTVKDDVLSFVMPTPKPIIKQHKPKESDIYGHVIAADFKLTDYYNEVSSKHKIEGLTTDQYIRLIKDVILPYQEKNYLFDGLAYLEVVGRITHKSGIRKVLNKEFLSVSIGASPNKLICSECLQDQVQNICDHYGDKRNNIFMLSESLNYKELSFVDKPADKFGKIVKIHDNISQEEIYELESNILTSSIDAIPLKDFFQLTDKTIVCMDNICTIINQKEHIMKKKVSSSYKDEFGEEKIQSLVDDIATISEINDDMPDRLFAIVQKSDDVVKRRFPINDEANVKLSMKLLRDAVDLSELEYEKAVNVITRAAKKFNIEDEILEKEVSINADNDGDKILEDAVRAITETDNIKVLCDSFIEEIKKYSTTRLNEDGTLNIQDSDDEPSPIAILFSILTGFANEVKYCGDMLERSISSYLKELGKKAIDETVCDSYEAKEKELTDKIKELEEELSITDEINMKLNQQLRIHLVDEIIAHRKALKVIDSTETEEHKKYSSLPYESLKVILDDVRNFRQVNSPSKVSIKQINDPTQIADSVNDTNIDLKDNAHNPAQSKRITEKEAIEIINSLKEM